MPRPRRERPHRIVGTPGACRACLHDGCGSARGVSGIFNSMRKESVNVRPSVAVVVLADAPLFELAIPCEVFGLDRRDLTERWYRFALVGAAPRASVGRWFTAEVRGLAALSRAETIIVPAVQTNMEPPREVLDALREAHARGARIASICSGAFVLAAAGLLDGRRAATHWMHAVELAHRHPRVRVDRDVLYLQDGGIWTSAGSAAGIDLCLELVRQDFGSAVANQVARRMVVPPHRDGGQAQYVPDRSAGRQAIQGRDAALEDWVRSRLAEVTVAEMARFTGVSERTLVRRFHERTRTSPQRWLQRERLDAARALLEVTDAPVDSIARRVGLGTATNLRQHFARAFATTPSAYRSRFQQGDTEGTRRT